MDRRKFGKAVAGFFGMLMCPFGLSKPTGEFSGNTVVGGFSGTLNQEDEWTIGKDEVNIHDWKVEIPTIPLGSVVFWMSDAPIPEGWVVMNGIDNSKRLGGSGIFVHLKDIQITKHYRFCLLIEKLDPNKEPNNVG